MTVRSVSSHLPEYQTFIDSISSLSLPMSASELHGIMCGCLCGGATVKGEEYLRALTVNKNDDDSRAAMLTLFDVYAVSQQQISHLDFEFQLMLPNDNEPLQDRALAFSEWCEGFTEGLVMAEIDQDSISDEDSQEAIQHLYDFSQIDHDGLQMSEEDERALMEVSEYARMAVLRLYSDLKQHHESKEKVSKAH